MDIRKLQYFISVANTLSFTKAAKEHYISQTAMSQQIAAMESELDVLLFDRNKSKVRITSAGEFLLQEAREIVEKYNLATKKILDIHNEREASISIGFAGPCEGALAREIIELFQEKYPHVAVNIEYNNFKNLSRNLEAETSDFVIAVAGEILCEGSVEKYTLIDEPAVLAMSKKHPKANQKTIDALDLKNEGIIMLGEDLGQLNFNRMIDSCKKDGFEPNILEQTNSLQTLILLVELNRGVSILPKSHMESYGDRLAFAEILNTNHSFKVELYWHRSNKNEYMKDFISIVGEMYSR